MKMLSDHLINLETYSECKGISKYENTLEKGEYIDASRYLVEYEKLFTSSANRYFGLYFGFFLNLKALGSVFDISLSASNIGQVVSLWAEYFDINFPLVKLHSYIDKDTLNLELDSDLENSIVKNQILDTIFTFVFRELSLMIGDNTIKLYLPYKELDEYRISFKSEIKFCEKHTFSFNKEILDKEINTHNKRRIENLLPNFLMLLDKNDQNSFSSLVKQMTLNMCNPELPTLKQVSIQFSMTERTLQRRLKREQTSYRNITNEIKRELFKYLKKGKVIKTKDLAYTLGYSSSSSLIHANKKWKEM